MPATQRHGSSMKVPVRDSDASRGDAIEVVLRAVVRVADANSLLEPPPAPLLHIAPALLRSKPTLLRPPRRLGSPPLRRRRGHRLLEQYHQPSPRGLTVHQLRPMLAGRDRHHTINEPRREPFHQPFPQIRGDRRRSGDIERQLDPRIRGVHPLTTRAGRPGESLSQFSERDRQAPGDDKVRTWGGHRRESPSGRQRPRPVALRPGSRPGRGAR
ncbi:MAG: hypothetical protein QOI21_5717 [Actinomycetota bacterium]|nr:hypothetical protein [Actinomycetota bacterium]